MSSFDIQIVYCHYREECIMTDCNYYLSLDSEARITNTNTVMNLMRLNR